jgi:hypothetical protein
MGQQKVFPYRFLIAPIALLLFAVGWYRFSVVYIQGANLQLVDHNNYSVYVPFQQISAYLQALREFTYVTVAIALIMFLYFLVRLIQFKRAMPKSLASNLEKPS